MQSIVSEFSSLWFASHWSTCLSARISTPRRGWRLGATFETHCVQCSATPWSSSTGSWRVLTQPLSVQLQVVTFKSVNHNVGTVLYKRDITKCLLWNFRRLFVAAMDFVGDVLHVLDSWDNEDRDSVYNEARHLLPMENRAGPGRENATGEPGIRGWNSVLEPV